MTPDDERLVLELSHLAAYMDDRMLAPLSGVIRRAARRIATGPAPDRRRCRRPGCDVELTGRQRDWHSDACRKAASRT